MWVEGGSEVYPMAKGEGVSHRWGTVSRVCVVYYLELGGVVT